MGTVMQFRVAAALSLLLLLPAAAQTSKSASGKSSQQVQAGSVTINMPEGMTRDQADEMLKELKAIHQLLEQQQTAVAAQPSQPVSDKVSMKVVPGMYSIGQENAPVTVVEFADYQCPYCRKFQSDSFAELKKNYIDTGKVRFVSRDFPLDFHPNAGGAAVAARCAGEQNKYWEMREMMVASTADLSPDSLKKFASSLNLDMARFQACLSDPKNNSAIQKDMADANALGVNGTPSFIIGKTAKDQIDGVRVVGAVPFSVLETAIKNQMATP